MQISYSRFRYAISGHLPVLPYKHWLTPTHDIPVHVHPQMLQCREFMILPQREEEAIAFPPPAITFNSFRVRVFSKTDFFISDNCKSETITYVD